MDLELQNFSTDNDSVKAFKANFKKNENLSTFQRMVFMVMSLYDNFTQKSGKVMLDGVDEKSTNAYLKRKKEEDELLKSMEEQRIKKLKEELDSEVSRYIDNRDEKKLISVLQRGYELTTEQTSILFEHSSKFPSPVVQEAVNENLRSKIVESYNEVLKEFYKEIKNLDKSEIKESLSELSSVNTMIWKRIGYSEIRGTPEQCLELLELTNRLKDFICDYSFSGKFTLKNSLDRITTALEKKHNDTFEAIHEEKMNKFSEVLNGFDSMKDNIVSGIIKNAQNFKASDIPRESREVINAIKAQYDEILPNALNLQNSLDLENLYKKRLPQIIEEYLTISPSYKQRLISHNDSPDVLLLDSLQEIKDKVEAISHDIEASKHHKMKTSNRYLKTI